MIPLSGSPPSQETLIRRIDHTSEREAENVPSAPGRPALLVRLVLEPFGVFARAFVRDGALLRGVAGLKVAGNEAALSLVTVAKIYERFYSDDTALQKRYRDFLDEEQ